MTALRSTPTGAGAGSGRGLLGAELQHQAASGSAGGKERVRRRRFLRIEGSLYPEGELAGFHQTTEAIEQPHRFGNVWNEHGVHADPVLPSQGQVGLVRRARHEHIGAVPPDGPDQGCAVPHGIDDSIDSVRAFSQQPVGKAGAARDDDVRAEG